MKYKKQMFWLFYGLGLLMVLITFLLTKNKFGSMFDYYSQDFLLTVMAGGIIFPIVGRAVDTNK